MKKIIPFLFLCCALTAQRIVVESMPKRMIVIFKPGTVIHSGRFSHLFFATETDVDRNRVLRFEPYKIVEFRQSTCLPPFLPCTKFNLK